MLLWPGVIASFARYVVNGMKYIDHARYTDQYSTYIMWKSLQHNDIHGPKAAAYRTEKPKGEEASIDGVQTASNPVNNGRTDATSAPASVPPY